MRDSQRGIETMIFQHDDGVFLLTSGMHISKPKYEFKYLAESLKLRALEMIDSFLILLGLRMRKVEIAEEDRYLFV